MKYNKYSGMADERPFNMAQLLLERLNELMKSANEARSDEDIHKWFRVLGAISTSIIFVLDEVEEKDLFNNLSNARGRLMNLLKNRSEIGYYELDTFLEEIEKKLVKLMYKYELYYPHYSKKSWQEKAREEDV